MPVLKPVRGIRLNKSHPLARGLVGYWLLNEGSGNKVFDLSGNGNTGAFVSNPLWVPGTFGSAIDFSDDAINVGGNVYNGISTECTIVVKFLVHSYPTYGRLIDKYPASSIYITSGDVKQVSFYGEIGGVSRDTGWANFPTVVNTWYTAAIVLKSGHQSVYKDGILAQAELDEGPYAGTYDIGTGVNAYIGNRASDMARDFDGLIEYMYIYNRALTASEIALLYREPFCMFDRAWKPSKMGGQIVKLAGTAAGTSDSVAVLSSIRGLTASTGGFTAVDGSLGIMGESPPEMERSWLREALFNGMTANAFKLGTSLSLGWFWVRVTGCSVLYRGSAGGGMGEIDFVNILAVSGQNALQISPPSYISHNNGSTYFYVVRRFNNCGYQEHTLAAAEKVSIKSNGELAEPQPNNISGSKAEQVDSNKVRLTWFYCPLEQGSEPVSFNVYYDDRTEQIDYQNPLVTIGYKGRKFYSFQSSALEAGNYLFAIRAEDADGIENISLARLKIQLDTLNPDAIDILRAEAV